MKRSFLTIALISMVSALLNTHAMETLELDVISYEKLIQEDEETLHTLHKALHKKGIVGVKGIPTYKEKYEQFLQVARAFSALPEDTKEYYKPNRDLGETFLGYEAGKEKFQRPNGEWVVDNLKTSYYAFVPDNSQNKWPVEVHLKDPFESLGTLMAKTGEMIMYKIGLLGDATFHLEEDACVGRMLYYRKSDNNENPYCCGAHFDHGLFTAILPAVYFSNDVQIAEPMEAGLFVREPQTTTFKKVMANDLDVMMFQVGEFGQVITNDKIHATEHAVCKPLEAVERYTLAVFYNAPMELPISSTSVLTSDTRYGGKAGESCTYRQWSDASFQRYLTQ